MREAKLKKWERHSHILIAPICLECRRVQPIPPSPKSVSGSPSHWLPIHTWIKALGCGPACDTRRGVPPQCQHPIPLTLKGASPGRCVLVCMHSAHVCACCMTMCSPVLRPAALCSNWWLWRPHKSPVLNHRASEPIILVSPGPEGPGKQSCGGGEGKDPHFCPSFLDWDEAMCCSPRGRWDGAGGTPRR